MHHGNVLIVDDEADMRAILAETLQYRGYMTLAVESAAEAVAMVTNVAFDLVLLDVLLPDRSGLDVIASLKLLHPRLKIIVLTVLDEDAPREQAYRAGADAYLVKPVSMPLLLNTVERVVG